MPFIIAMEICADFSLVKTQMLMEWKWVCMEILGKLIMKIFFSMILRYLPQFYAYDYFYVSIRSMARTC